MDKTKLNQEIVLCRSVVKRAKVCVIRKLIRTINILRSCKKEELREKKLRKGRRLAAEIHMMKTLRPDYVTKFGLLTENYVSTGSNTKLKRKRNACAKLVKHKYLADKINLIRNKFSNWREELPLLLESSKKKTEDEETTMESNEFCDNMEKSQETTLNEELPNERFEKSEGEEQETKSAVIEIPQSKVEQPKVKKTKSKKEPDIDGNAKKKSKKKSDCQENGHKEINTEIVREKVDDPFFIGKKVMLPKLMQTDNTNLPENGSKERKWKSSLEAEEDTEHRFCESSPKSLTKKMKESTSKDELHPSWKAKKIQMIKPFEGKKIKFE